MLTTLPTLKSRLEIDPLDLSHDDVLTNALNAVSFRFDKETNRTLARTVNLTQEFDATDTEICLDCYPFESLTKFELKSTEAEGWVEQTGIDFLIRRACILSLAQPLNLQLSTFNQQRPQARVTYTGGYVLPGTTVSTGQIPLPADLENATSPPPNRPQTTCQIAQKALSSTHARWSYNPSPSNPIADAFPFPICNPRTVTNPSQPVR